MSHFFQLPYNYESGSTSHEANASWAIGDPATEVSDGRIDTSSTSLRYIIDFAGTDRKSINAVFVVTSVGITTISLTWDTGQGSGATITNLALPSTLSGNNLVRSGRRYNALTAIPLFSMSAARVRVEFGGAGRVYGIALTRRLLILEEDKHWTDITHTRSVEDADRRVNINGRAVVIPPRYADGKWRSAYTGYFPATANPSLDATIETLETHLNFYYHQQPENSPTWFYPATLDPVSMRVTYVGRLLSQRNVSFTIQES